MTTEGAATTPRSAILALVSSNLALSGLSAIAP